ncbi:MAG: hypothetical protein OSA84_03030 [Akkermansiaceae bacterium]|nr:hypothetical protein [Akkermansiaceae bacterium]
MRENLFLTPPCIEKVLVLEATIPGFAALSTGFPKLFLDVWVLKFELSA